MRLLTRTRDASPKLRPVPFGDINKHADLEETVVLRGVDQLDALNLTDDIRARLSAKLADLGAGDTRTFTSVVVVSRLVPGGVSMMFPDLELGRRLFVAVFGPDGIDLHVVVADDALVMRVADGDKRVPDLVEQRFAEMQSFFLPYHGLGTTAVSGHWLKTDALDDGFRAYRHPDRSFAVDPDVLAEPAVRQALNTRR